MTRKSRVDRTNFLLRIDVELKRDVAMLSEDTGIPMNRIIEDLVRISLPQRRAAYEQLSAHRRPD